MEKEFYMKFPCVLRSALLEGTTSFSREPEVDFNEFDGFRMITRTPGQDDTITHEDFYSQAESHLLLGQPLSVARSLSQIGTYSCSIYTSLDKMKQALKFPHPNQVVTHGVVHQKHGVKKRSKKDKTHIHVWLYDGSEIHTQFEIIEVAEVMGDE